MFGLRSRVRGYGLHHERRPPNQSGGAQRHGPHDREVLILRHFEELSNAEAAQVLGIKPSAAVNRYVRALKRLKDVFQGMPGGSKTETMSAAWSQGSSCSRT